ncbi:hypothetical protein AGR4C_pa50021 [Agrobacterium tumefaciens str. Kerr 14]|uniref:Uncharacterized protein n=1 Tax=Agrobacterium tumefaciens str. Kerr 14 TaxID=1183424 RepID=A0A1S7SAL3_AGRTU|nr:hypothetical protein AGR4C_pa50021 [Agrobacterium tumefaciens str. Kerr 14]
MKTLVMSQELNDRPVNDEATSANSMVVNLVKCVERRAASIHYSEVHDGSPRTQACTLP